jgi:competence protein ComEA
MRRISWEFQSLLAQRSWMLAINAWAAVDINTASVADLDSIKGIGPGTSAKILEQRKTGKFKDWADLVQRVSGIGEVRASKLSNEGLTVDGKKFSGAASATPKAVKMKSDKTVANAAKPPTK